MLDRNELAQFSHNVQSKADFEEFLRLLLSDLEHREHEWENPTLPRYLDAMWGFVISLEGHYHHRHEKTDLENPTWNMFARILFAASVYE